MVQEVGCKMEETNRTMRPLCDGFIFKAQMCSEPDKVSTFVINANDSCTAWKNAIDFCTKNDLKHFSLQFIGYLDDNTVYQHDAANFENEGIYVRYDGMVRKMMKYYADKEGKTIEQYLLSLMKKDILRKSMDINL
jgi:hypothetical protein